MEKKQGNKLRITTQDGKPFRIPVEGSLGLLALGYKGLIAWRQAKWQFQKMKEAKQGGNTEQQQDEPIAD
ncbi:MAG TPA: hypothetical protein PK511_13725 [Chitinophagales bacterium]|nr:hypothetical protein [Chitinophagales bacterium]HMZ88249.1 hypothetical protein [Chitinophagales bacterium]HNA56770.1 hypothetical protein [Chitinophagales bacterium]HNE45564.1 hypothetical protein [Chitinophagales bacterium]HNF67762.1 hypothetical protein [Chitinophagales bacterium]